MAGHVLGTAWAGFRVSNSKMLQERYNNLIVNGTCDGIDLLGNWWDIRTQHTVSCRVHQMGLVSDEEVKIPVIAIHVAALLIYLYLSTNIYKVDIPPLLVIASHTRSSRFTRTSRSAVLELPRRSITFIKYVHSRKFNESDLVVAYRLSYCCPSSCNSSGSLAWRLPACG